MDNTNYTTGTWLGVVRNGAVVALEAGTDPAILGQLWKYLGQEPTIDGILHEVTEKFGTGLVNLPSFAILLHGERLQAILRGDITLAAHTHEGTELVSGHDVATWSERSLSLPEYLELRLSDAPMPEPAMELPVGDAVVRLQSLRMGWIESEQLIDDVLMDDGGVPDTVPPSPPADETAWAQPGEAAELAEAAHGAELADWAGSVLAGAAADEMLLGAHCGEGAFDEDGHVIDESFAMAAQAANAEWNAQLAPMSVTGVLPEHGSDMEEPEPGDTEEAALDDAELVDAAQNLIDDDQPLLPEVAQPVVEAGVRVLPPLPSQPPVAGNNVPAPTLDLASATELEPEQEAEPDSTQESATLGRVETNAEETGAETNAEETGAETAADEVSAATENGAEPADAAEPDSRMPSESAPALRLPTGPMILARVCLNGHANPPSGSNCNSCGAATESELREVGRPRLGAMHVSTGEVIDLDHSLIIGRQPSVTRVMGEVTPQLVQVTSRNGDISRSHVEVRLNGWDVLLVDLEATNGTVLVREGQEPRRLGQGEEVLLLDGDVAELGDGVSLRFDGVL